MNPYLQLLLQKRPQLYPSPTADVEIDSPPPVASPTFPLGPRPQQPTVPVPNGDVVPVAETRSAVPTVPLAPRNDPDRLPAPNTPEYQEAAANAFPVLNKRDIIGEDRQRIIDAQNKPHSKWKDILEGVGQYAAGGIGLNLHHLLHPRGTETEQAQRQLSTDLGIQQQQTVAERAAAETAKIAAETDPATIALRGRLTEAQIAKINAEAEKAKQGPTAIPKFVERDDGVYEISTKYPEGRKVGNIPAKARSKNANPTRYFERPDGVYGVNDEHPEGFKVKGVPGKPAATTGEENPAKIGAEYQSHRTKADSLRGNADAIDKQLRGYEDNKQHHVNGLYDERAAVQTEIGRVNWKGADTDENLRNQHEILTTKLAGLSKRIDDLERQRDQHYQLASDEDAEALKYKRSQGEQDASAPTVNRELMPDNGRFDRNRYIKTFQRMHGGKQPTQEQIEDAEVRWTNP